MWGCVCACSPVRGGERREILGRWSLGLQLTNLNEGFISKLAPRFVLSPLVCWVSYFLIRTYEGLFMYIIEFTGKSENSFHIGHKSEDVNMKLT